MKAYPGAAAWPMQLTVRSNTSGREPVAVPIARDVIKAYYDKKQSHQPTLEQAETQARLLSGPFQVPSGRGKP